MALQTSGEITFEDIFNELQGSLTILDNLTLEMLCTGVIEPLNPNSANQPTTSAPFDVQSWYGYDHAASSNVGVMTCYADSDSSRVCAGITGTADIYYDDSGVSIASLADLVSNDISIYQDSGLTRLADPAYYGDYPRVSDVFGWDGGAWAGSVNCA